MTPPIEYDDYDGFMCMACNMNCERYVKDLKDNDQWYDNAPIDHYCPCGNIFTDWEPDELLERCPQCGSTDIGDGHEDGTHICAYCLEEWGDDE